MIRLKIPAKNLKIHETDKMHKSEARPAGSGRAFLWETIRDLLFSQGKTVENSVKIV